MAVTRTILITGASRGIGLALAKEFADRGWRVIACCRRPEAAKELREAAARETAHLRIEKLDVTDPDQVLALASRLRHDTFDILFNNAGWGGPDHQDFGQFDESAWLEAFKVNAMAPLRMAESFIEQVAGSRGRIIATMGSVMGSISDNSSGGYYIYRSTKAAVHMVMKNLAIDLKGRGIIAVVFHPGWVRTEMGGANAPLTPEESAAGLYQVLTSLNNSDNGKFLDYQGRERSW
jgi:NAD(P)-dependent dehydrogenase (short-subunit alcohol dehydrogenase family)